MKKYYAREVDYESFDPEAYFTSDDAIMQDIWIGGNRDFITLNESLYDDITCLLDNAKYDIDEIDMDDDLSSSEKFIAETDVLRRYFAKDNSSDLSDSEITKLFRLVDVYWNNTKVEREVVCDVLGIIQSRPFKTGILHGTSQSDYIYYICPDEITKEYLDYIEAVYFGTGTEYEITEDKYEREPDFDSADVDTYFDYTNLWKSDDVKNWLAKSVIGCNPDEVVVLKIKDRVTYTKYNYEEV